MDRLRTIFPDREFIMRSQGRVRFVKVSSRMQVAAASVATLLLVVWLISVVGIADATRDRLALLDREAKVATAESRVTAYRDGLDSVAEDLAKRQSFIEAMVSAHIDELPADTRYGETASSKDSEADKTVRKVSAAIPEAGALVRIEARQIAFVERLTRYAEERSKTAAETIREFGLNPNSLLASVSEKTAKGGPYLKLATSKDGSLDPRFKQLGVSLARMDALDRALSGIPQVQPASMEMISSGFGYRSDPFNGSAAFHAGLDFKGARGAPIYAAAKGVVRSAGRQQGYGNCIEIDHGNGLVTRYAHMSKFKVKAGQKIAAGDVIGAIGSTGRSTGPHLHFEVRIHGRPVNPRPFLEAAPHVFEKTARTGA